jgi:hypothetical protein
VPYSNNPQYGSKLPERKQREMTTPLEHTPKLCRNCAAPLEGEYCSRCGQREDRGDLHFSEAIGELADDVVAWDSRLWRTLLPLVFKPGYLTAEFIAGRKARYVAPYRLYLIISFILFLVISGIGGAIGKSLFIYFSYAIMLFMGFAVVSMLTLLMM